MWGASGRQLKSAHPEHTPTAGCGQNERRQQVLVAAQRTTGRQLDSAHPEYTSTAGCGQAERRHPGEVAGSGNGEPRRRRSGEEISVIRKRGNGAARTSQRGSHRPPQNTVVLRLFLYVSPVRSITVVTVMLWALDRVRGRALGLLGSGSPKSQPHQALRGVSKPTTGFPFTGGKW